MKWSKEKEKEFEKIINHIIETIENKKESDELPKWVVDQLEKRLEKVNNYYDLAKKCGWRRVASLMVTLLAMPISLLFTPEDGVIFLAALTSIMGLAGFEQYGADRRNYIENAQDAQEELVKWICDISDPEEEDCVAAGKAPDSCLVELPQDMKEYFVGHLNNDLSR